MPIENCDYFIYVIPFHLPVPSCCRLNPDGTYSLYLNSEYDWDHWIDGYEHELWHIIHDDFYGDKDILEIERQLL